MSLDTARAFLGWCTVLNMGLLTVWFLMIVFARDAIHRLHGRWFRLTEETFDTVHYAAMAVFKLFTLMVFAVPYLVLRCLVDLP